MLNLTTESDLVALHTGVVKESLHIEYKQSDAVDKKSDARKLEMARDISAFANADGGQIIYGMREKDHEPDGLDAGLDPREYPEIWFEQVLQQHVTPLVSVSIRHVPLSTGRVAVVISVPATSGDPHQVDGRYYRRHNFNRLAMEHYEVRDMFRRATQPDLTIKFMFDQAQTRQTLRYTAQAEHHAPVGMTPVLSNRSNEPTLYAVVLIYIDTRVTVLTTTYERLAIADWDGVSVIPFRLSYLPSQQMPIFKEQPSLMPALGLIIPEDRLYLENDYKIAYEIRAPGCHRSGSNLLCVEYGKLISIEPDKEPPI